MIGPLSWPVLGPDDVYLLETRDGSQTVFSRQYQATYHSIHGAVSESRHVFLQQGLKTQDGKSDITILEYGFGTGLNALIALLYARRSEKSIHYHGLEKYPIDPNLARQLNYAEYLVANELSDEFIRMHTETAFETESFSFRKYHSIIALDATLKFDCIFFDAFAPTADPDAWTRDVFFKLKEMTNPAGCLITYCARGEVRRNLQSAGYRVERIIGPPGKREMLRAWNN